MEYHSAKPEGSQQASYIYRNLVFKDFEGVVLADPRILDVLSRKFPTRPHYPLNSYKIDRTPNKGMGMFARRDIRAGGLIVIENPVIVLPMVLQLGSSLTRDEHFKMFFDRLDPDVRLRAFTLFNCKPLDVCSMLEGIIRSNGIEITLPQSKSPSTPTTIHSGVFFDIIRFNHR